MVMNILLISPYFSPMVGGVETHLDDLCSYFRKQKYSVYVRTYKAFGVKPRGLSDEEDNYIHIHRLWWPDLNLIYKLELYPILKFIYIFPGLFLDCLIFLFKKNKSIDTVQAHGFIAAIVAVILGKIFNKRIIINTHVGFRLKNGVMTDIIRWTLLNCNKVLVLTSGIKESLVNLGIPKDAIDVYHYWVDQNRFKIQKNAKKKLGWENKFIVLFVGRLIEVKGVRRIFELAKRLKKISFVMIGSGPLSDKLKKQTRNYSNILFLGKINNQDLPLYYNGADLLLIPSKIIKQEYEEGIPRVMIEALSCGLPVIATKSGGIQDIHSNEIGLLVDDNVKSMVGGIKNMINKGKDMNKIRSYSLKLFSIKNADIIKRSLS